MSSQPTTLTCAGTRRPAARSARIAPIAVTSLWHDDRRHAGVARAARPPPARRPRTARRPDLDGVTRGRARPRRTPSGSPRPAGRRRCTARVAPDVGDPPVSEAHQVLDREPRPALVVAGDDRDGQAGRLGVDDHDRHGRGEQPPPAVVGDLARRDDHAVDPAVDHEVEVVHGAALVVRGAAQHDRVAEGARAATSAAWTSSGKNGFWMSVTMRPSVRVRLMRSERATPEGR